MKVSELIPLPTARWPFRRTHQKFVPDRSGCYVLTTFDEQVLYVGLTVNLRRRLGEHLDSPLKTSAGEYGRAVWFHFIETDKLNEIERAWLNLHIQHEGRIPVLNRIYSPTAT